MTISSPWRRLAVLHDSGRIAEAKQLTADLEELQAMRRSIAASRTGLFARLVELDPGAAQDPTAKREDDNMRLIMALQQARKALLECDQPEDAKVIADLARKLEQQAWERPTYKRNTYLEYTTKKKTADGEDRIDRLEKKVDRLADTVEKLLHVTVQRQRDEDDAKKKRKARSPYLR